jgi:hypothetical protein
MYGVECGLNMAQCSGHFADMVADIEAVALVIARKQQDSIVASMVPYYRPYAVSVEVSYRA